MFTGTTTHSIDSKGRIVLPACFRAELGESFYIAKGFYDCVQVLSVEEFTRLRESISALPAQAALSLQYDILATARLVAPNSQGRVPIPADLREVAGLDKEASVLGMDNRLEIWDPERLREFKDKNRLNVAEALSMLRMI